MMWGFGCLRSHQRHAEGTQATEGKLLAHNVLLLSKNIERQPCRKYMSFSKNSRGVVSVPAGARKFNQVVS